MSEAVELFALVFREAGIDAGDELLERLAAAMRDLHLAIGPRL